MPENNPDIGLQKIQMDFFSPELLNEAIKASDLHVVQIERGLFGSKMTRIELPFICVDYGYCSRGLISRGGMPTDRYTIAIYLDLFGRGTFDNEDVTAGDIVFLAPGKELDGVYQGGHEWCIFSFPAAQFEAAWSAREENRDKEIERKNRILRKGHQIKQQLTCMGRRLTRADDTLFAALQREAQQLFTDEVLELCVDLLLVNASSSDDTFTLSRRRKLVQRTERYLEGCDDPVRISKLARELGVSVRQLEYAFKDIYGMTPHRFLQTNRLNKVRRMLLQSDNVAGKVTEHAMNAGYWHLSQFAIDYHALFGELPSETLKKTPYSNAQFHVKNGE